MEIAFYFIGFFTGGLTLAALAALELPSWAGILFTIGCVTISVTISLIIAGQYLRRIEILEEETCN